MSLQEEKVGYLLVQNSITEETTGVPGERLRTTVVAGSTHVGMENARHMV